MSIIHDIIKVAERFYGTADQVEALSLDIDWPELVHRAGYDATEVGADIRDNVVAIMRDEEIVVCHECGHRLPDAPDYQETRWEEEWEVWKCSSCGNTQRASLGAIPS